MPCAATTPTSLAEVRQLELTQDELLDRLARHHLTTGNTGEQRCPPVS